MAGWVRAHILIANTIRDIGSCTRNSLTVFNYHSAFGKFNVLFFFVLSLTCMFKIFDL